MSHYSNFKTAMIQNLIGENMKKVLIILILIAMNSYLFSQDGIKVSGQLRHRYEVNNKDFNSDTGANTYSFLRARLNIMANPSDNLLVHFQLQDSRLFGEETNTLTDGSADAFDLHQGYVKLTNFMNLPLTMKLGRYEVNYGPQRFIGAVGWHNIGRSFDGATFTLNLSLADVDIFSLKEVEDMSTGDEGDKWVRGVYSNLKLKDYTTQAFYIMDADRNTLGVYAKGKIFGNFYHETEFAIQNGSLGDTDLDGLFYAFNFTYKLNSGIKLSAGLDFVSGDDTSTESNEAFNTLYSTNHKYYGFMDYFLNLPENTNNRGLNDLHFKIAGIKLAGIVLKGSYHIFTSDIAAANGDTAYGNELDLTFIKKYSENVKFVGGYSIFTPGDIFKAERGEDNSNWLYLMTIVNF